MKLTIKKPDDWHLHLRDGKMLAEVVAHTIKEFARALIMPNLIPPILTVKDALNYHTKIEQLAPNFAAKMALYLTTNTTLNDIKLAGETKEVIAYKLYPQSATTNSQDGVNSIKDIMPILQTISDNKLVLCVHGESTKQEVDIFDREQVFIDETLSFIVKEIPELKIVLEHISTKQGVDFVQAHNNIAGSLTAHHLLENRNSLFNGGIRPHNYCLPILKRSSHQKELIKAAISGNPKFFGGTDSAPHLKQHKESACGCAGIYTAHAAVAIYAEVFEQHNALDNLEKFLSINGANFYGLPTNTGTINLEKTSWEVPKSYFNGELVPFKANQTLNWKVL